MARLLIRITIALLVLTVSPNLYAQLGKLKDKLENKVNGKSTNGQETNEEENGTENETEEEEEKKDWPINESVMTSDFHRKNVGNILYSKTPIIIGKEDPAQFTTQFTAKDKIYAMVYLSNTIEELTGRNKDVSGMYTYLVDNNPNGESGNITFIHNDEDLSKSYYSIEIIPDMDKAVHGLDPVEWANALSNLSPKKHTIKVSFTKEDYFGDDYASGKLELDWTAANIGLLKANAQQASEKAQDNYARAMTLPEWFYKTNYQFKDPELNMANLRAILEKRWAGEGRQIIKFVVGENNSTEDWVVFKNDLDIPTHKSTNANIGVVYKANDGWCYFVPKIYYKREYTGGGTYSNVQYFAEGRHTRIDCNNVK